MINERILFNHEHDIFRQTVSKFLMKEAIPCREKWEEAGMVDREIWLKAGECGFLAPMVQEEYGGAGANFLYNAIVAEEVSKCGLSGLAWSLHSDICSPYIAKLGTEYIKQKYLPKCVSGEVITAIAMSEPHAGSDLKAIKTTAVKDGDDYIINGSKTFISNGQLANIVIVVAKTEPDLGAKGLSLFLVEADMPGFSRGRNLKKIGVKAQDTSELYFDNVRVPKENLLGAENHGFIYLMNELPQERLSNAILSTAACEAMLATTVDFVKERKAFGQTISQFQNTQFTLAELDTEITAARVFTDHCLALHIEGKLNTVKASKAKLLTSELQCKVADECVQLHGGYGYMWDYPIARAYADARVSTIWAGTSEIMKLIIGRELLNSQAN